MMNRVLRTSEEAFNWKAPVPTFADLPLTGNDNGDVRLVIDINVIYSWDADRAAPTWIRMTDTSAASPTSPDDSLILDWMGM